MWHEGLEEASRLCFQEHNMQAMWKHLESLHKKIKAPGTLKEQSFLTVGVCFPQSSASQTYDRELNDAFRTLSSLEQGDVKQAWDLYYTVFKRITNQLGQLQQLNLKFVSPRLLTCDDLELAVPGTYAPKTPLIRIKCLRPNITVISSKQRPRKICIIGSDGRDYNFQLKGHEDSRLDERVMQLLGLVNSLLDRDPQTSRRNLKITVGCD